MAQKSKVPAAMDEGEIDLQTLSQVSGGAGLPALMKEAVNSGESWAASHVAAAEHATAIEAHVTMPSEHTTGFGTQVTMSPQHGTAIEAHVTMPHATGVDVSVGPLPSDPRAGHIASSEWQARQQSEHSAPSHVQAEVQAAVLRAEQAVEKAFGMGHVTHEDTSSRPVPHGEPAHASSMTGGGAPAGAESLVHAHAGTHHSPPLTAEQDRSAPALNSRHVAL